MTNPDICHNCGAHRNAHTPAANGGLDCPARRDGKVPIVVGHRSVSYAVDEVHTTDIIEWRKPEPKNPIEVLHAAAEGDGDGT